MILGSQGLARLRAATVAVVGLGGVGSYAVEALARSGVGRLILIDPDEVCLSNINRQLVALHSTIGRAKVAVASERLGEIGLQSEIVALKRLYTSEDSDELLAGQGFNYSYLVDAIDSVVHKVHLITSCIARGIPIVSVMGTGNKLDPTLFSVVDISKTHTDPLARAVRLGLRGVGIDRGLKCVFSPELPTSHEPALLGSVSTSSKPGSVSFVPSVAGLIAAGVVVRDISGV